MPQLSFKQYINLIKTIRNHQKLSNKRHPALTQNKVAKFFAYFSFVAIVLYLMMFSIILALAANSSESITPCGLIYGVMPFILTIDFFFRFVAQQTPSQLVKPYVLLPIPRMACIDSFVASSLLSLGNIVWFGLFIPYTIMSVIFAEGILTTLLFLLSLYIMILTNSQWYAIVRTLLNKNIWWWALPIAAYALIFSPWYLGKGSDFSSLCNFYAETGNAFVVPRLLSWLLLIAVFVTVVCVNRRLQFKSVWSELAHVEQTRLHHASQLSFFNRFGIVGEYMKLEAKSAMRNKMVRNGLVFANVYVLIMGLLIAFTEVYDNLFMTYFLLIYSFAVYGSMILVRSMSAEGNYIDGLMIRRENILALLAAKYYFYTTMLLVPFVLMLPTVISGKYSLLMLLSIMIFSAGFEHCLFMQFAVYNKQTMSLNTKFMGQGNMENNYIQVIAQMAVFFLPILILYLFHYFFSDTAAYTVFLIIGLCFIATHRLWLRNIYKRLMRRRYENMEGFRATRP